MRDFADHHADWVDPITTNYRGYDVYELPPNTQGITALEMLNILEGFDLKALGHNTAEYLHLIIEAKRIAYADRDAYVADPESVPPAVQQMLLSKEYAAKRRKEIDPLHAAARYLPGSVDGKGSAPGRSRARPDRRARSRRHDLPDRGRRQRQRRLAHPVALRFVRLGARRRRHRHHAAEPRQPLHARAGPPRSRRAAQASAPHAGAGDGA